ncbi:helix-hairpin-helix domain-containing protein [Gemmatimonadota bacterium]
MATNDLATEIRRFASEHPEGWGHEEWLGFLNGLSDAGHDIGDGDAVGLALESERLSNVLGRMEIKGLGPKRIDALAEHFGTLWNLMSASPEDLAQVPSVSRSLGEQILGVLQ